MEDTKHYFELKGKNAEKIVHDLAEKTFLVKVFLFRSLFPTHACLNSERMLYI